MEESESRSLAEFEGRLHETLDVLEADLYDAEVELLGDYRTFKKGDIGVVNCTYSSIFNFRKELPVQIDGFTCGVPYRLLALRRTGGDD